MSKMGTADQKLYAEYKKSTIDLIDDLHTKGIIKQKGDKSEIVDIMKIFQRMNSSQVGINKLFSLMPTPDWKNMITDLNKYGLTEQDILNTFGVLIFNQILDLFELLKTAFLLILEKTIYKIPSKKDVIIDGKETLGAILYKIDQLSPSNTFSKHIDKNLRNAIGHGKYWVENDVFYYKTGTITSSLSIAELFIKMREINLLTICFTEDGMKHLKTLGFTVA